MKDTVTGSWRHYDVHGLLGVRVRNSTPSAEQLDNVLAPFATRDSVPADLVVTGDRELLHEATDVDGVLRFTDDTVELVRDRVQVQRTESGFKVCGPGQLLDAVTAVLDVQAVERGAAMFRGVTVAFQGAGVAMPATRGSWRSTTIAKLMKHPGYSFMGDDWAFVKNDSEQLGFAKPMSIEPGHQRMYPHLYEEAGKSLIPAGLSAPVRRMTTAAHPYIVRQPRLANLARRWSPDRSLVSAGTALPDTLITDRAALELSIFVERYDGARTTVTQCHADSMVDRMMGNYQFEMPRASRDVVNAMDAALIVSAHRNASRKTAILRQALELSPCYVVRVPSALTDDDASDDLIYQVEELIRRHDLGLQAKTIDLNGHVRATSEAL